LAGIRERIFYEIDVVPNKQNLIYFRNVAVKLQSLPVHFFSLVCCHDQSEFVFKQFIREIYKQKDNVLIRWV
jgi:hypothetical protein